jgi:hypothetical protein
MRKPFRIHRLLVAAGIVVAGALASVAMPSAAQADIQPCDPFDPGCNPHEWVPPQYIAIGQDRDEEDAQEEAQAQAAAHCPGFSYDVIRMRATYLPDVNQWKYTLTYSCS